MARQKKRIGWKKVVIGTRWKGWHEIDVHAIAKLEILGPVAGLQSASEASNAVEALYNKSRCGAVKVLRIERIKTGKPVVGRIARSRRDPFCEYRIGKVVEPRNGSFRMVDHTVCGVGIHFFWRREDAVAYRF